MFKKLITKLYNKYCTPKYNIVELTKVQMLGTTQPTEVLDLPNSERKQIADEAKTILDSEVFKLAVNNVKQRLMMHIQLEAPTAEIIFYDRFSINGVALVEDELRSYSDFTLEEFIDDEDTL